MTSPAPPQLLLEDVSLFGDTQISESITADDSPRFFQQHGVFYQAVPGMEETKKRLGRGAQNIAGLDMFDITDERLLKILESYTPTMWFVFGPTQAYYHSFTIASSENENDEFLVYIWGKDTKLEFFHGSHATESKGVTSFNRMFAIPFVSLKNKEELQEVSVHMEHGE